ncbi:aminodeoxychorismate synthase component I [Urechidicola croceus]|uniref:aminodeoxychorismate synthase n=1 Tax=Urechidicola croceus TaxID=1850246 RepID=A0A1D8PAE5_9FLAO|nr:aminodeoxychorismate synthase component I [Urechidicola croceus]AOW21568.1 aminodeoxychorismate synthase, component I [Urechidicola croceus]
MQRTERIFSSNTINEFKSKLLAWAQKFDKISWLDSNNSSENKNSEILSEFDAVLAVDMHSEIQCDCDDSFGILKEYQQITKDYIFGYLGYDLKNDIENLQSKNFDGLHFPDLYFFQPKKIFFIKGNTVKISYLETFENEIESDLEEIINIKLTDFHQPNDIKIKLRIHKDEYFDKISKVLAHILRGDIYEVSFCQEFYAENSEINPFEVYQNLNEISTPPFATYLKLDDKFLLSASPERFLKRSENKVISQPIKGTIKRGETPIEDIDLKFQLENDLKERAENIMIVDLVRNDLSRTAIKGSVKVAELCKVYTFKQVHQLISTVVSEVKSETNSVDIIKSLFPMGSMTGAPKISAMKIIEELEETKRGLYSGAVGYFTPSGNFDFNVVIRSILYNESEKYISYSVGGAITAKSIPEKEYEECLLKAKAMREVLLNTNS